MKAATSDPDTETVKSSQTSDIEDELMMLRRRIEELTYKHRDNPSQEPDCVSWSIYEQSIGEDPIAFIKAHMDVEQTPLEFIKRSSLKSLEGCCRFFKGINPSEKKAKLMAFLRRFQGYRTKNLRLLEQRLYVTRKWMKENGFSGNIEELHDIVKI